MKLIQLDWKNFLKKHLMWKFLALACCSMLLSVGYFKLFQEGKIYYELDQAINQVRELEAELKYSEALTDERSDFISRYRSTYNRQRGIYQVDKNISSLPAAIDERIVLREQADELLGYLADEYLESIDGIQKDKTIIQYLSDHELLISDYASNNIVVQNIVVLLGLGGGLFIYALLSSELLVSHQLKQTLLEAIPEKLFIRHMSYYGYTVVVYFMLPILAILLVLLGYSLAVNSHVWQHPYLISQGDSYIALANWQIIAWSLLMTLVATALAYQFLLIVTPILQDSIFSALIFIALVSLPIFVTSAWVNYLPYSHSILYPVFHQQSGTLVIDITKQLGISIGYVLILQLIIWGIHKLRVTKRLLFKM